MLIGASHKARAFFFRSGGREGGQKRGAINKIPRSDQLKNGPVIRKGGFDYALTLQPTSGQQEQTGLLGLREIGFWRGGGGHKAKQGRTSEPRGK